MFNLDRFSFSPSNELELILFMVNKQIFSSEDISKDIDWDHFIELTLHHRLYPVLYKVVKQKKEYFPNSVYDALGEVFLENTMLMLKYSAELHRMNEVFIKKQIPLLVLKGPYLGTDLYGELSLRTCNDLDILVPMARLSEVENTLNNMGYIKEEYIETVLNDWKWRHHHFVYIHPEKLVKVEVHWRLHPGPGKEPSFQQLWERKREVIVSNYSFKCLSKEDLFVFLVVHGARHGWSRLRWLLDIHQLTHGNLRWNKVQIILKKYQYQHLAGQALLLSHSIFNTPMLKEFEPWIKMNKAQLLENKTYFYIERVVNLHSEPLPPEISNYHKHYVFKLKTTRQQLLYIFSCLFPFPRDVKTFPLPKQLHILYFLLRPFLVVFRKAKEKVSV
ncbi:nucleotidyltransferase family protein [Bacillus carboniphilus]|uniref:Nucleotidyltransferase family protein n=1 Tax=Bacillus carboniphilus TaxID=86663 RepID=A0ABY9JTU1_9BACI|nr:nucleotidyltransferase family protein [Bacillus carboniphilus]WLR42777.1 nucleotidyltransferase family protein [Bacillus carboniphilus]